MKILLAEDDQFTREGLSEIFEREGYNVTTAGDGAAAIELFRESRPDMVVLDIMMPEISGYDVCRKIRKEDKHVPVIFLSAKSEEIDKVVGLELGADDYISKPFGVREVVARIRAVTRRVMNAGSESPAAVETFVLGDLEVYPAELKAQRGTEEIDLSLRDVKILSLFARNRGKVLSRDEIYNTGWGISHMPNSRTLDQHISQLRKKIEVDPKNPQIITTVHSAGYRYP
jgi:two-component system, OmpR family, alkaline phosphatase synthesis response regulator PhoP